MTVSESDSNPVDIGSDPDDLDVYSNDDDECGPFKKAKMTKWKGAAV